MAEPQTNSRIEFAEFLAGVTEQLVHILTVENGYLRARDYTRIESVQAEKARLTFAYESQLKLLRDNPAIAMAMSAEHKKLLTELAIRFDAAATENFQLLEAARQVNLRVMEAIRDAAMEQSNSNKGYGAMVNPSNARTNRTHDQAVSVSLNQKL